MAKPHLMYENLMYLHPYDGVQEIANQFTLVPMVHIHIFVLINVTTLAGRHGLVDGVFICVCDARI